MPAMVSLVPDERSAPAEFLRSLKRHRVLFVLVAGGLAALAFGIIQLLPTRYTAYASVVISPVSPDPLQAAPTREDSILRDDEVSTQAALMMSRDLALTVVEQVAVGGSAGASARLKALGCTALGRHAESLAMCRPRAEETVEDRAAGFLLRLRATPGQRTRLIDLSYTDADPDVAAEALNALVVAYQQQQIAQSSANLARTSKWITDRAETLRRSWAEAEAKAAQFRAENGLGGGAGKDATAPFVTQQLSSAGASLSTARAELSTALARLAVLRAAGSAPERMSLISMRDEPGLVALATQLQPLRIQLAEMKKSFNANYPGIGPLEAQIAALQGQMAAETGRALHAVEVEAQVKQAQVNELQASVERLRGANGVLNGKQGQLGIMEDEARGAASVFETFVARARQLDDRASLVQSQVHFAAHATAPELPSAPDLLRLYLGAGVLSLSMGGAAVWLREFMARGFSNISRIGGQLAVPFLCAIPAVGRRRGRVTHYVQENPFSSASESMRTLLSHVQLASVQGEAVRTVVVASATGQEGKTTVSIWLAGLAATSGRRVLLVDGDHRRGTVNARCRGENTLGFSDMLFGSTLLHEAVQREAAQGFDFIGAGGPVSRPFGSGDVAKLQRIVGVLEEQYDLVIIDTPPLLAINDALVYASVASGTVFLCRWTRTSRQAVASCLERLRTVRAEIIGVALSMVDHKRLSLFSDELTPYDVRVMKRYYVR